MAAKSDSASGAINPEMVARLARLARLKLSAAEVGVYQRELGPILAFIDQLRTATLADIDPVYHVGQAARTTRPDKAVVDGGTSFPVGADLVSQLPANRIVDDHFRVPRVL